jgi:hypothetical protein
MAERHQGEAASDPPPVRKPTPPYAIIVAWVTLHAYLLATTSLWFPHLPLAVKAAVTCSFAIGLGLIISFYLGRRNQWRALSPYLDRGAGSGSVAN